MIHENAWQLLPDELPPDLPMWINPALDAGRVEDQRLRLAYGWAHKLLSQINEGVINTVLTGGIGGTTIFEITDISAGFIPFREGVPDEPGSREQHLAVHANAPEVYGDDFKYSFGVIIGISGVASSDDDITFISEPAAFVTLYDRFPVILERRMVEDAQPIHPAGNATSTCFVKPQAIKRYYCGTWMEGILVARHVLHALGTSLGTYVSMENGKMSTIVEIDRSASIDAAILDATPMGGIPTTASPIVPPSAMPPGTKVTVRGRYGSFNADILRVMDDSRYFGNLVAHRIFIDAHGVKGDSGALATTSSNDAVGLYIGKIGGAVSEGLLQSMRQVCEYFQIDLLD